MGEVIHIRRQRGHELGHVDPTLLAVMAMAAVITGSAMAIVGVWLVWLGVRSFV